MKKILLAEFLKDFSLSVFKMSQQKGRRRKSLKTRATMTFIPQNDGSSIQRFVCNLEFENDPEVEIPDLEFETLVYMADHTPGFSFPDATPLMLSSVTQETLFVHMIHSCKHEIVVNADGDIVIISPLIHGGELTATPTLKQLELILA